MLLSEFGGWAAGLLAVVAGLIVAYFKGRSGGRTDERQETEARINKQSAEAREVVRNVQESTESMDDAAVRDAASEWVQHDPAGKGRH